MKVDRTNLAEMRAYRERIMTALIHADYLSPVDLYQREWHRVNREIAALEAP